MSAQQVNVDDILNRVLAAVAPYRARAHEAQSPEEVTVITNEAMQAAMVQVAMPLTSDLMFGIMMAAVLRLADMWNADATSFEIPDSL